VTLPETHEFDSGSYWRRAVLSAIVIEDVFRISVMTACPIVENNRVVGYSL
jgi:hypothetical protein